jgi:hypothetical protein
MSGVRCGWGCGAPRLTREAEGTRSTLAEAQVGQQSRRRSFWESKSLLEPNHPSNR